MFIGYCCSDSSWFGVTRLTKTIIFCAAEALKKDLGPTGPDHVQMLYKVPTEHIFLSSVRILSGSRAWKVQ